MYAGLTLLTPPAGEPVSVATLKLHSRVTNFVDDGMLGGYLTAARQYCENHTSRSFLTQTWKLALQSWPGRDYIQGPREFTTLAQYYKWNFFTLPRPPFIAVVTFTYTDTSGNVFNMQQGYDATVGNYLPPDTNFEPARIVLPFSGVWPTTILLPGAPIQITYTAGYASFAGTVNVDSTGKTVTWVSGSTFDPGLAGTFIDIVGPSGAGQSATVQTVTSTSSLTLQNAIVASETAAAYTANLVPHSIKQAILLEAAHLYQNREAVLLDTSAAELPFAVRSLLDQYRNYHPIQERE